MVRPSYELMSDSSGVLPYGYSAPHSPPQSPPVYVPNIARLRARPYIFPKNNVNSSGRCARRAAGCNENTKFRPVISDWTCYKNYEPCPKDSQVGWCNKCWCNKGYLSSWPKRSFFPPNLRVDIIQKRTFTAASLNYLRTRLLLGQTNFTCRDLKLGFKKKVMQAPESLRKSSSMRLVRGAMFSRSGMNGNKQGEYRPRSRSALCSVQDTRLHWLTGKAWRLYGEIHGEGGIWFDALVSIGLIFRIILVPIWRPGGGL